jgi:hypothetical protein
VSPTLTSALASARVRLHPSPRRLVLALALALPGVAIGAALRSGVFWLLATSFVLEAAAQAGVTMILVSYLREAGHPPRVAATLPLLIGVLAVPIRLTLGRPATPGSWPP